MDTIFYGLSQVMGFLRFRGDITIFAHICSGIDLHAIAPIGDHVFIFFAQMLGQIMPRTLMQTCSRGVAKRNGIMYIENECFLMKQHLFEVENYFDYFLITFSFFHQHAQSYHAMHAYSNV